MDDDHDHLSLDRWLEHYDFDMPAAIEAASLDCPELFAEMVMRQDELGIEVGDLAEHASVAWRSHADALPWRAWRDLLFYRGGYRVNGEPADRPTEALVLWRGALPHFRANQSWSDKRDAAHQYASGWWVQDEIGVIWRAVVEPDRLLSRIGCWGFNEYLVDTDGLQIDPHGLWCRCDVDMTPFLGSDQEAQAALDIHELIDCPRIA